MSKPSSNPPSEQTSPLSGEKVAGGGVKDFLLLTKAKLNFLVVITAAFGFLLAARWDIDLWLFFHVLFGCGLCALASGAFNQLIEAKFDKQMQRTANRPLPSGRLSEPAAMAVGWILGAWGIIHLATRVTPENPQAAWIGVATLVVYVLIYTPMKRWSSLNTIMGSVAGALPPVLGWVGTGEGYNAGAYFVFGLQFLWQMPHFMSINWLCREEYERAGFVMWANGDESGRRSAWISIAFTALLLPLSLMPAWLGLCAWWAAILALILALCLLLACLIWLQKPSRETARRAFFASLLYLPLAYLVFLLGWKA